MKGKTGKEPESLLVRFCRKVILPLGPDGIPWDDPHACWLWAGYVAKVTYSNGLGYGQIRGEPTLPGVQKLLKAHVVSHLLFIGPVPYRWDVCHACDNTICVNPHHLYAAPHVDNMADYIRKYGGICRSKDRLTLDQLQLFRDGGHEPFLSETYDPHEFDGDPAPAPDSTVDEGEVPF